MNDDETSGLLCSAAPPRTSTDMGNVPRATRPAWKWLMGLNVKLAWLISLGFITGISWIVTQVAPRTVNVSLPQAAAGQRSDRAGAETSGRFSKPSMIESENSKKQNRTDRLVAADAPATRTPQVALPPISSLTQRVEADETQGVASDSPSGLGQLLVAMPDARPPAAGLSETHAVSLPPPFASNASAAQPAEPPAAETYTVQRGDNLHKIAKKLMKSNSPAAVAALSKANPKVAARKNQVRIGETIVIPSLAAAPEKVTAAPASLAVGPQDAADANSVAQPPKSPPAEKRAPVRGKGATRTAAKSKSKSPAKVARAKPTVTKPSTAAKSAESAAPVVPAVAVAPQSSAGATKPERSDKLPVRKPPSASKVLAKHERKDAAPGRAVAAIDGSKGKKKSTAADRAKRSGAITR